MAETLNYYSQFAATYFDSTVSLDLTPLYERFLNNLPSGALILDLGCGSGRDTKHFLANGYRVHAIDACPELAALATKHTGNKVELASFHDITTESRYDAIWACASLLHVPASELPTLLNQLWQSLKPSGRLYLSFQSGPTERTLAGRHYTDLDIPALNRLLATLPQSDTPELWQTTDLRPNHEILWTNALLFKHPSPLKQLIPGGKDHHFLPHLCHSISQATEINVAVSFTKTTGLRLLLPDLEQALTRNPNPARLRILTSDYLDITDPEALRILMLLSQQGAEVKIFESHGSSFHLKAWIFIETFSPLKGQAYIGSSNISEAALQDAIEWNYRIDFPPEAGFEEARHRFDLLFHDPKAIPLTHGWINDYERRRKPPALPIAPGSTEREAPPTPSEVQQEALAALAATRNQGYSRGLVVMATGLGKTWLAAFDAVAIKASRILFVAHREEILKQAAETFLRIRPGASVGYYMGDRRDSQVDILCASIQTLGKLPHLEKFPTAYFDYIVVDEFHHAAALTYRKLLNHFEPKFLLGLTATPDRTDQSSILSLCDDNLVFTRNLFNGIESRLLAPFHYYGIFDETIDYKEVPWRGKNFDPERLEAKLATLARARHAHKEWQQYKQSRTLAFCISIRHADFMADQFQKLGIRAAAVHGQSRLSRSEALAQLRNNDLDVLFSVDLFNEGVDLPEIDTVMLLRPTDSSVLFLQQIGRGLRLHQDKSHLAILDFIGNDKAFLNRSQLLATASGASISLADFCRKIKTKSLPLPDGCFINYDLQLLDFMRSLDTQGLDKLYQSLKETLERRPTRLEFHRAGAVAAKLRNDYNNWPAFLKSQGELEAPLDETAIGFLAELETTSMTKSFKMILLEAFQELDGWQTPPTLPALADRSWQILHRRPTLLSEVPNAEVGKFQAYWRKNPVGAWLGENTKSEQASFKLDGQLFTPTLQIPSEQLSDFTKLVQEMIDYRLSGYQARQPEAAEGTSKVIPIDSASSKRVAIPYFPNLAIACGHFRTGTTDSEEHRSLGEEHGRLSPEKHFIARASGNSMDSGTHPIKDGDYLLLEHITPQRAGSITGSVMAIERTDTSGDNQYLLRNVLKSPQGEYILRANNPDYADMVASEDYRTLARLKAIIEPWELAIGQKFKREDIPALFGEVFNVGNWNLGHVVLREKKAHILLVTLNKQGRTKEHQYRDHWIDDHTFHWQSQNQTSPQDLKGREIINHQKLGIKIHLFIREEKLANGKSAPFNYFGPVDYSSHRRSKPMSVVLRASRQLP